MENTEANKNLAEEAFIQLMGDVVATSQKWIELSNAVQAGEMTDIKALEGEYSRFLLPTVVMTFEMLQSKYGNRVSDEADRNLKTRSSIFEL